MLDLFIISLNNYFKKNHKNYVAKEYISFDELDAIGIYYCDDFCRPILVVRKGNYIDEIMFYTLEEISSCFFDEIKNAMIKTQEEIYG